ncbi:MAG TPA: response regulator [Ramlibacter sp.]|nr:response regulator [Ramlibacter sp.]
MDKRPAAPILLVDDEPANLLAMEAVLEGLGEPLVRARSGEEAMRRLRDQDFAAVLLDLHMPGMDGIETARLIRAQKRSRETPILFITADASELGAREAYSLGAVDFIVKPFRTQPLIAKLAFFIELHRSRKELHDAERQAVQDRVFLSAVLEAVEDAIIACDPQGRLTLLNRAAREFLGLPVAGMPAGVLPARALFRRRDGSPMPDEELPLQRALKGERVQQLELVLQLDGAPPRPVVASGQALYDESGQMLGAVVSLHDISASLEAKLLRESRERLAESDRRKTEFLATLAHELRNPLAPISNGLHLLRRAGDVLAHDKALDMIDRQLTHMVHLVDDLLDIARISSNKVDLRRERLDLAAVLAGAIETSMPLITGAGHTLDVHMPAEPLQIEGDATRLSQIVSNLLNNAAKYTPHGGRIELSASQEGGEAVVRVSDTGIGIAAPEMPKVFEMFTQVGRNFDRAQGGLGIGLALVKRLVELHSGTVEAMSAGTGRGSTFVVRLPLTQAASAPALPPAKPLEEPCGASFRVMVVDDNVDAAESLAALLEIEGHQARIAHDGEGALRVASEFVPHVVFLDIGMPGMNGYQVARELRSVPDMRDAVVVALTGWGGQEDRARSRNAGFDHHLTKPASLASVEALLAEIAASESRRIAVKAA